jgi:hypothetical protein
MRGTFSWVRTSATPGIARAREASMRRMRACGCGEWRMRACSIPGSAMSSTKVPRPVASLTLSTRRSERPTVVSGCFVSATAR